jgi:transposase
MSARYKLHLVAQFVGYEIVLVNAQHMHAIAGHKTDRKDSEWIADLLRHGLTFRQLYSPQAYSGTA